MQILKYHVLLGRTTSSDLPTAATFVDTLSPNSKLSVKNKAPQVSNVDGAGTATVTAADLMASQMCQLVKCANLTYINAINH